jgi:hypothetical protein
MINCPRQSIFVMVGVNDEELGGKMEDGVESGTRH